MIFIVSKKAFLKNAKALIRKKDFVVIDATDDSSSTLSNIISPVMTKDDLAPPSKCVMAELDPDYYEYEIDKKKVRKLWKGWIKRSKVQNCLYAIFRILLEENLNIFIIISNKAYKALGDKYCTSINNELDSRIKFVYTYEEYRDDRESLIRDLSKDDTKILKELTKEMERDLESNYEDDDYDIKKKKQKDKKEEISKNYTKYFKKLMKGDAFDVWK